LTRPITNVPYTSGNIPPIVRGVLNLSRIKSPNALIKIVKIPSVRRTIGPNISFKIGRMSMLIMVKRHAVNKSCGKFPVNENPLTKFAAARIANAFVQI